IDLESRIENELTQSNLKDRNEPEKEQIFEIIDENHELDKKDVKKIESESTTENDVSNKEESANSEPIDSWLINELKDFKGIKDLKTCKISSKYDFKPSKIKLEKLGKFCALLIESEQKIEQSALQFCTGVVDGRPCLLNVFFGESQITKKAISFQSNVTKSLLTEDKNNDQSDEPVLDCYIEMGPVKHKIKPFFTRQSSNSVHKLVSLNDVFNGGQFVCTSKVPFDLFSGTIVIILRTTDFEIRISSSLFNYDDRTILEEKLITGTPFKSFNNFVKIRNMFNSRDEVLYFKHLRLYCKEEKKKREKIRNIVDQNLKDLTKNQRSQNNKKELKKNASHKQLRNTLPYSRINTGKIHGPVGMNGCFMAEFIRPVRMGTKIWISVYKVVDVFSSKQ
ncbi:hypothetical protein M153_49280001406, partial [Pseudoloma neurophilia]